ncbi:MAG: GNAT family N-acetyltransferase [Actinobacteria bacterium]|nr:GNAT family N-acetyltransferase [Actinomycetota bacterium]
MSLPITTERLVLRVFTPEDAEDHFAYWHLPEVAAYVPWEPGDRAQARASLQKRIESDHLDDEGSVLFLAVELGGWVVGEVMLSWVSREHQQGEVGFALHPGAHGRGIGSEAAREMLRLGFETLDLHRIFGRCDTQNTASARMMERLGMRREAHLRENEFFKGRWSDEYDYAILQAEWRARSDQS